MYGGPGENYDVIVAGGGPAGVAAAFGAASCGVRVGLIEKYGFLGGMATAGLVGPFMSAFAKDRQVVKGVFQQVIDRLIAVGGAIGHLKCPYPTAETPGTGGYITPFDREMMKFVLLDMMREAGIKLLLHSSIVAADVRNNRIDTLWVHNKSGFQRLQAKVVVDCTGDGDVAYLAGCGFAKGREADGLTQGMTLFLKIDNVDHPALRTYIVDNPDDFRWFSFPAPAGKLDERYNRYYLIGSGFKRYIRQGISTKELALGRDRVTFFSGVFAGEMLLNATRFNGDGTDIHQLIAGEIDARGQAMSLFQFVRKYLPGFANAKLAATGCQIGVRETRRIMGGYLLSQEDVFANRRFDDCIAKGSYPVDIHEPGGTNSLWYEQEQGTDYDIPYRCLVARDRANLLLGGRCISATHEAHASARVMPTCMATGQAAGVAAALSVRHNTGPDKLNYSVLRQELLRQGACLE